MMNQQPVAVSQNGVMPAAFHEENSYRTRSISQEILKTSSETTTPIQATTASPLKPAIRQQTMVTSPTSTTTAYPQRGLPNEHQIRYGSERPAATNHQLNGNQMNGNHGNQGSHARNLPNELVPRFGSERPASSMAQMQQNHFFQQQQQMQQMNGNTQRYTHVLNGNGNVADVSPIKQQNARVRQASLSELDEINYNNRQNLEQQQHQQQQQQQQQQPLISNQFEDLYGKVRNGSSQQMHQHHSQQLPQQQHQIQFDERPQIINMHQQQQQFKTLPSRNGHMNNTSLNTHMTNGKKSSIIFSSEFYSFV